MTVCNNFHIYSPEAIGVWALSSGERSKEKNPKNPLNPV
jgi:hypothetical protein